MTPFQPDKAHAVVTFMQERPASFEVSCPLAGVSVQEAWAWRRLGLFGGDEVALEFHNAVLRQEAEVVARAEQTLFDLASGKCGGGGTRAEARAHNVQLHAAVTLLEKMCPERYGKTKRDEVNRLRRRAADELLDYLRQSLPDNVFQEVLVALATPTDPVLDAGDE
jgi:hypothetical protein